MENKLTREEQEQLKNWIVQMEVGEMA